MNTTTNILPGGSGKRAGGRIGSWRGRLLTGDKIAHSITLVFAACVVLLGVLLVLQLWWQASLAREKFGWQFLISSAWNPVTEQFGALPFIYGTLVTSGVALVIAVPLGLGAAIFLAELAPRTLSDIMAFVTELLAAIPSVIIGLIGIFVLVPVLRVYIDPALQSAFGFLPIFAGPIYGVGLMAAGLVLAIMIVPFIITVSREILLAVPADQREAALALGATKWESTWKVVVPYARSGIIGSVFLALARALGETMAVTMVIGNAPVISTSLFAPGNTIASVIANEFAEAMGTMNLQALIELGLVLFAVTIVINALARLLVLATTRKGSSHP